MPDEFDKPDDKDRAARLRERIAEKKREPVPETEPGDVDPGPRPGESPHAYVERRMRDTVKKNTP
jgi:hypothetical protein